MNIDKQQRIINSLEAELEFFGLQGPNINVRLIENIVEVLKNNIGVFDCSQAVGYYDRARVTFSSFDAWVYNLAGDFFWRDIDNVHL